MLWRKTEKGRDRNRGGRGIPRNRVLFKMVARIGLMDKILFKQKRESESEANGLSWGSTFHVKGSSILKPQRQW